MQDDVLPLQTLLSRLTDALEGYREGADLAESPMMVTLMSYLYSTHLQHVEQLTDAMDERGIDTGGAGSAMALVHKAILNIRSILSGLDERILPGLIDGEQRLVEAYDEAIAGAGDEELRTQLQAQRATLVERIGELSGLSASVDAGELAEK